MAVKMFVSMTRNTAKSQNDACVLNGVVRIIKLRTDCADILRSVNYLDRSAGYIGKYLSRYVGERTAADKAYRI